jgi:hypothetical protein
LPKKDDTSLHESERFAAVFGRPDEVFAVVLVRGFKEDLAAVNLIDELAKFVLGKSHGLEIPRVRFQHGDKMRRET